jgi:hypothetical protein
VVPDAVRRRSALGGRHPTIGSCSPPSSGSSPCRGGRRGHAPGRPRLSVCQSTADDGISGPRRRRRAGCRAGSRRARGEPLGRPRLHAPATSGTASSSSASVGSESAGDRSRKVSTSSGRHSAEHLAASSSMSSAPASRRASGSHHRGPWRPARFRPPRAPPPASTRRSGRPGPRGARSSSSSSEPGRVGGDRPVVKHRGCAHRDGRSELAGRTRPRCGRCRRPARRGAPGRAWAASPPGRGGSSCRRPSRCRR